MDRLTSLTVFCQVAESGGFSAAARRLNLSTTMVSTHVQALEERLGARLLNRTTRKVSLTETGRAYFERATQILAELEEADSFATALHTTPRGTLRLYTSAAIVRFLAPVVDEFLARYPDAAIDLTVGERAVDMVEEAYDLAIRTSVSPDSTLIARQLTPWRHVLCCAPGYLDAHPAPEHPAELARHNCLRYAYYPFGNEWRFHDPAGFPVSAQVTGSLVTTSGELLRAMTLSGRGLFLAPSFIVADDLEAGRLVALMPDYQPVEFAIAAVYPSRRNLSAKLRAFLDLAAARFAAHRRWMMPGAGRDGV